MDKSITRDHTDSLFLIKLRNEFWKHACSCCQSIQSISSSAYFQLQQNLIWPNGALTISTLTNIKNLTHGFQSYPNSQKQQLHQPISKRKKKLHDSTEKIIEIDIRIIQILFYSKEKYQPRDPRETSTGSFIT